MSKKSNSIGKSDNELSYQSIATILDSIDAMVYVSDMNNYELLYLNKYGRDIWGEIQGKTCWKTLQEGQEGPCSFCTNDRLLDKNGQAAEVYVWEFQNTINKHWYQCRDQAIPWIDGRLVRMEIATDITDRKLAEEELEAAKKKAEELAGIDELTGLNNRRAFFDLGKHAFKQATRFNHFISVIMMDIDHFKNINDTYGHSVGDKVLQLAGQLLTDMVREIDIVARIGGEEFAFILPETGLDEARQLTERLRHKIETTTVTYEDNSIQITASFGISSCSTTDEGLETMLTKADDALYIAKRKGRNQINAY
ncbi:MAG: GGDEF domain-containing protein [Gammaproteobacteria bacterium]|nr:GGDEF domain-containing protein [Gammaproteobacteria bacterium]MCW8911586.1 GGDEF domain-containing protein [Gammaproteobacteria bacterium]MCW9005288.1 GGDEF domain-containing protein [Gammaproteobacteria bacterium]MCW9056916.1 GGDEF domain-containing protein [Gammaproteobacteria bacterium]